MIASMRTPLMHRLAGDDVLAARAGGGDDLAFATLVRRLQPRLLAYCATILGNVQDADDAVQNTFIRAHDGLRGGDHVLAVRPWLYRIAHNEAISLMRRRRPAAELVATVPDHAHGPAEAVAVREEVRAVLHAIGELPDRSRDAFLLREVGGMRHAEVAEVLGTSPGTARQAVFEARVALQDDRAGRDASCHAIREEISARERRRASRTVRGHLRSCTSCRDWSDAQGKRRKVLGLTPSAGASDRGRRRTVDLGRRAGRRRGGDRRRDREDRGVGRRRGDVDAGRDRDARARGAPARQGSSRSAGAGPAGAARCPEPPGRDARRGDDAGASGRRDRGARSRACRRRPGGGQDA